jgi:hypothetical protein
MFALEAETKAGEAEAKKDFKLSNCYFMLKSALD